MNHNKLITEELKAITALMSYDRSKTLMEQMGHKQFMGPNPSMYRNNSSGFVKDTEKWHDDNVDMVQSVIDTVVGEWDSDTAGWVELGLTIGGLILIATGIGSPLGTFMVGAGTTVGVADAGVRYYRGDTFGGTLMLALQIIPGSELITMIKGGKSLLKTGIKVGKYSDDAVKMFDNLTEESMMKLNEKAAKETLSKTEAEVMEMIMESAGKQEARITLRTLQEAWKKMQVSLYEATLESTLIKTFPVMVKIGKWGLKTILQIGGTAIGIDLLWKLISINDPELRKIRNVSEFGVLLDMLYGGAFDKSPEWIQNIYLNIWKKLWNEDGTPKLSEQGEFSKLISGNITEDDLKNNKALEELGKTENMDKLLKSGLDILGYTPDYSEEDKEMFEKGIANVQPVNFDNLVKGLQTIRKGQKGDVVRDIQRMLVTIGYDLGNTGKTNDGVDGDFGDTTEAAVYNFQIDYDLDGIDGIVGEETADKLYELFLKKTNSDEK